MAPEPEAEQDLVAEARALIEQGLALQGMDDVAALEAWDEGVNDLLERVNTAVATGRFSSRSLQSQLEYLIDLYRESLATLASLQDDQAAASADLHQQRWRITG